MVRTLSFSSSSSFSYAALGVLCSCGCWQLSADISSSTPVEMPVPTKNGLVLLTADAKLSFLLYIELTIFFLIAQKRIVVYSLT